jgi:hypothetical protein
MRYETQHNCKKKRDLIPTNAFYSFLSVLSSVSLDVDPLVPKHVAVQIVLPVFTY